MENTLFRKKVVDKISSPEQLTDYLRVTNPSIWLVLSAVVFILIGIISWSFVGVLTTKVEASAVVYDGGANIVPIDTEWSGKIKTGMTVVIAGNDYVIAAVDKDEYGRPVAHTPVALSDGNYEANIIVEQIHPVEFLIEGR